MEEIVEVHKHMFAVAVCSREAQSHYDRGALTRFRLSNDVPEPLTSAHTSLKAPHQADLWN